MGGAHDWVQLEDGTQIYNHAPLCFRHHEQVTNNEVTIKWDGEQFVWDDGLDFVAPLTWQPIVIWPDNKHKHVVRPITKEEAEILGVTQHQFCPTCKRKYRHNYFKDNPPEEKRPRQTIGISVPKDRWEDGAEVLEELFEGAREKLEQYGIEYGEGRKNLYFLLATVLALFIQHGDSIMSDG